MELPIMEEFEKQRKMMQSSISKSNEINVAYFGGRNNKAAMRNTVQGSDTTRYERRSTAGQTKTFIMEVAKEI
ncbi:hypothetical protein SAE01_21410 [Segetibacter aerophilus]|uniref:Uncharacterized protein n=2 Tax=Segetibacter aerophilus TaxID=670293 RepID=A0A512BCM7_9BACT|nr:hypothetical protein SAE01_21410 [Segetibacter aerophilus]